MQRQQIVQRSPRSKQNMEDTSFYIIKHEPSYMFHKRSKQNRRDGKTYAHKSRKHWDQARTRNSDSKTRHSQI
jgi:hypothetical protein